MPFTGLHLLFLSNVPGAIPGDMSISKSTCTIRIICIWEKLGTYWEVNIDFTKRWIDLKNRNKYLRNYPCDRTGKNIKITPPPTLRHTSHKRIILPWGHVFKRNIFRILFFLGNICAKLILMCVIPRCHKLGQLRLTWKEMTSKSKCFPFVKKGNHKL